MLCHNGLASKLCTLCINISNETYNLKILTLYWLKVCYFNKYTLIFENYRNPDIKAALATGLFMYYTMK